MPVLSPLNRSLELSKETAEGKAMVFTKVASKLAQKIHKTVEKTANRPFYHYPFGKSPLASPQTYRKLASSTQDKSYPIIDDYCQKQGFDIDPKWVHDLALHTQIVIKNSELCYQHGRVLYTALRTYLQKHPSLNYVNIVETGTARGFSSLCMAKALHDANIEGKIVTFDVLPHQQKMFWNCIDDHEGEKTREELLSNYRDLLDRYLIFVQGNSRMSLEKCLMSRVHFAYLDGAHEYEDVIFEFQTLKNKQKAGDFIVFDDFSDKMFPGVVQAVNEISEKHGYQKQTLIVNEQRGYAVAEKS